MSELRQDILTGEWIVFAQNRKDRPYHFIKKSVPKEMDEKCQFCPGNEELTPGAIYQDGENGQWNIRVFPNMYPAVCEKGTSIQKDSFYCSVNGLGCHDVLVDTPDHEAVVEDFSIEKMKHILCVLKKRYLDMKQKEFIQYIQIFKNKGPDAGASIYHSHWQTIATPVIPKEQMDIFSSAKAYWQQNGKCIFCDILEHERNKSVRVIDENKNFLAFCPYASRMGYEVWIMPKKHISYFGDFEEQDISDLAPILKRTLQKVSQIRKEMSYNICFHDTPLKSDECEYGHWYLRVIPRMGSFAGFEFATSSYINPVLPEDAAKMYREMKVK